MAYATNGTIGVNLSAESEDAQFALGMTVQGSDGSEWVYVKADASGVTGEGYVVVIDEDFNAPMLSTSNDAFGDLVGVAPAAVTASYHFWAQRKGVCNIRVAASAAANAVLNTTATAGELDDDATAGSFDIDGLILTTANGGSAGTAAGALNYPTVGAVNS